MKRITLSFFILISLLMMFAPAQAGTVYLNPSFGPPGTVIIIGYSGSVPTTQYTCNINGGMDMGWIPQTSVFTYTVPSGTPIGTLIYVNCRQEWNDEPDPGTAVFTVTAPDSDGDGLTDDVDACPFEFAQTQNGCPFIPDSDGDGIGDPTDQCPFEFAQTSNGCPNSPVQPNQPTNTLPPVTTERPVITPQPTTPAYIDPNLIGTIDVALANCVEIKSQAMRLPIGALLRVLGAGDPCGKLTNTLRDFAFGTPRDGNLNLINQALDLRRACGLSGDAPSLEYLNVLSIIYALNPALAVDIHSAVSALENAPIGSIELETYCAFMAMYGPSMERLFPSTLDDRHRFAIAVAAFADEVDDSSDLAEFLARAQFFGFDARRFLQAVNNMAFVEGSFSEKLALRMILRRWQITFPTDFIDGEDDVFTQWLVQACGINWLNFSTDGAITSAFGIVYFKNLYATSEEKALLRQGVDCNSLPELLDKWYSRQIFLGAEYIWGELTGIPITTDEPNTIPRELIEIHPDALLPRNLTLMAWYDHCDTTLASPQNPIPQGCVRNDEFGLIANGLRDAGEMPFYGLSYVIYRYDVGRDASCDFLSFSGDAMRGFLRSADDVIQDRLGSDGVLSLNNLEQGTYIILIPNVVMRIWTRGIWSTIPANGDQDICIKVTVDAHSSLPMIKLGFDVEEGVNTSNINPADWLIPQNLNIGVIDDGQGAWLPPESTLRDLGVNNPMDTVSWRPPPIPPREVLVDALISQLPPDVDVQTVLNEFDDTVDLLLADMATDAGFGMFVAQTAPDVSQLFIIRNDGVGVIDLPFSPLNYQFTEDGGMVIVEGFGDNNEVITLLIDPLVGQAVRLVDFTNPMRAGLEDATDVSMTPDGELLTFVRDGDIFVKNQNSGFIAQITNTGNCSSPIFDAVGLNLYFVCDGVLSMYGLDGVRPIVTDMRVQSATIGPVDGTLIFDDGQVAYLSDLNGEKRRIFLRLNGVPVSGIRWQPSLPMSSR
jgi:hypothetical protein